MEKHIEISNTGLPIGLPFFSFSTSDHKIYLWIES